MLAPITIRYPFRPARRSLASAHAADLFGLAAEEPPHVVAESVTLDIRPGDLALFTGPSGSGKSSLLRAAGRQLGAVDLLALDLPDVPLIDALPGPVEDRLAALAACGLSEARLLLRTPGELSDGQRYRFRIAYALASGTRQGAECERAACEEAAACEETAACDSQRVEQSDSVRTRHPDGCRSQGFLLADEFAAILDRPLAKVLAFNLRKLVSRAGVGVLCATTHDDLADDLNPDVCVSCLGDGRVEVERRAVKKNASPSPTSFGCRTAPAPTGRTSRGGITAATTSPTSAG